MSKRDNPSERMVQCAVQSSARAWFAALEPELETGRAPPGPPDGPTVPQGPAPAPIPSKPPLSGLVLPSGMLGSARAPPLVPGGLAGFRNVCCQGTKLSGGGLLPHRAAEVGRADAERGRPDADCGRGGVCGKPSRPRDSGRPTLACDEADAFRSPVKVGVKLKWT